MQKAADYSAAFTSGADDGNRTILQLLVYQQLVPQTLK